MDIVSVVFITLFASLLASVSQLLFKSGMRIRIDSIGHFREVLASRRVTAGFVGYVCSLGTYLYALRLADLSIVYPIFASTFVFVTVLSALFLKEEIGTSRAFGVAAVLLGILVIASTL